ncbi:hypothetical protein V8693_33140, partial [Pseudomonas aeruginosa]
MFSCSKIEQKQLNTWVSFQSAEQPLLGQFSVSGNTLALLNETWLGTQTILMLEPRRLAARAAAERLASELGERVGET